MYLRVCLVLTCPLSLSPGPLPFCLPLFRPSVCICPMWLCWARVGVVLPSWCLRPRAGSAARLVGRPSPCLGPVLRWLGN